MLKGLQMRLRLDSHAHVFHPDLPFVSPRRYTPAYAATVDDLLSRLDAIGAEMALLTQPSFLGTDNTHMLGAVAHSPRRLRAVVVVDESVTSPELDGLRAAGAVGIRLNLASVQAPDFSAGRWPLILSMLRERDWHVEVFGRASQLASVVDPVIDAGVRVCVDHFGHPESESPLDEPGFLHLLSTAATGRVWVKLSASYRCGERAAMNAAPALLDAFGPNRLLWGSDWPHTQHEALVTYESTFADFARWVPDASTRETIMTDSAAALLSTST